MKPLYLSITALCLLSAIPLVIHNANATTPQLTFGSLGSGPGQLNVPRGIAVDGSGNIYVADNRNHRVEEFDSSGKYVAEFDKGGIPEGIAIYNGNIYVVDRNSTSIEIFSPKAHFPPRLARQEPIWVSCQTQNA
ncbi:MAG: SBBP repeat-containing protein [Nitrosotalea sp.]